MEAEPKSTGHAGPDLECTQIEAKLESTGCGHAGLGLHARLEPTWARACRTRRSHKALAEVAMYAAEMRPRW